MSETQEFYLNKRGLIETVIDQLKHCCQIEHTRHRKPANAFTNLVAGLSHTVLDNENHLSTTAKYQLS